MQSVDFFAPQWHSETTNAARFFIYDKGGEGNMAAISQLTTTIRIFKHNHDINLWHDKRAYVCNYKHPHTPQSYMSRQERFREEVGVRLFMKNEINISTESQG